MDIGIIGAGITGLTAAYDLAKAGHAVTVYEARPYVGGLAAGFRDERWDWAVDRFYRHWFASDKDVIRFVDELGVRDRLFFPRPTTSIYYDGQIYPFDSALRVLRFDPISFVDRLRVGLVTLYLRLLPNWESLERSSAHQWLRRAVGQRAYEVLWEPMLISKFDEENYREVNMAWFWARMKARTPRLGYFRGGFQAFADILAERIAAGGGSIHLETPVERIRHIAGECLRLEIGQTPVEHERVIATCSPEAMLSLAPSLPDPYAEQLAALESMGALALILALDRPLTDGHYWINVPASEGLPFMGLVEHTNYVSPEYYGGDHIVYCGDYLPPDHAAFGYTKERLFDFYRPGLVKINADFRPDWVRKMWMVTEPYAQPVPKLNHSQRLPALETPIPGLWLASMSQVYPWDRGTNFAVRMGRRVAREVMG